MRGVELQIAALTKQHLLGLPVAAEIQLLLLGPVAVAAVGDELRYAALRVALDLIEDHLKDERQATSDERIRILVPKLPTSQNRRARKSTAAQS